MENIEAITAAPMRITISGKDYELSPLRCREWGLIQRWLRESVVSIGCAAAAKELDYIQKQFIMSEAFNAAQRTSLNTIGADMMLQSADGVVQLLWQSLHQKHPKLTIEDVAGILQECDDWRGLYMQTMAISGQKEAVAKAKKKAVPKKVRRKQRKKNKAG